MNLPIDVFTGDAVVWTRERCLETAASQSSDGFNRIIALDCAYQ